MSKEEKIIAYLRELIEGGRVLPGMKIPSEYQLAKRFAVNKGTANKAVSHLVSQGVLERFRGAAGTLVKSQVLPARHQLTYVGNILSGLSFSSKILLGAELAARSRGYAFRFRSISFPQEQLWEELAAEGSAGILAACLGEAPADFPLPVVHVANLLQNGANYVYSDDAFGTKALAEYLLNRKHTEPVLLFNYATHQSNMRWRIDSFFAVYQKAGYPLTEDRLFLVNESPECNIAAAWMAIQQRFPHCRAIFCGSDHLAMRMLNYLKSESIQVPEQISLAGFGNMEEYQSLRKICTVNQFPQDMGSIACQALMDIIEKKITQPAQRITHAELLKGDTVDFCQ